MMGQGGFWVKIGSACFASKVVWAQCICHGKQSSLNHAMYSFTDKNGIDIVQAQSMCGKLHMYELTSNTKRRQPRWCRYQFLIGGIFMCRHFSKKKKKESRTKWHQTFILRKHTQFIYPQYKIQSCWFVFWVQGSYFFGLTKFHDISMIFPGFSVNFQVFFHYF